MNQKELYRLKNIDGLRAIAVISVVLGHYFPFFKGGYLGVDIFFVISGFVITKSLVQSNNQEGIIKYLTSFYAKRIRRLFPSLFITVLITLGIIIFFISDPRTEIFQTGKYSLLGISNVYLYHISSDYFGLNNSFNPFMHTWSLGVEEQFYLVFPLLIYFTKRNRILKVTITLCVLSAFANILTTNSNASFYLLPFRAFELALGVTAFLCSKKLKLNPKSYLVLVPIILTSNSKHHFFFTLTITLITFLLILDSNSSNLSIHPLQWIGERSYTIYLFHWPLLYLENYLVGDNIIAKILTIVVTLFLSSAQYKFIEKPIINLKLENRIIYFITLIILILVGLFCVNQSRTISQLSSKKYFAKIFNVPPRPQWVGNLCSGVKNIQKITNPLETCLGGPSEKPTIYVLGDSHADQFLSMINLVAAKYGYEIRNINQENDREFPQAELNGKMSDSMSYLINKNMIKKGDILILAFHHGKLNEFRDDQIDLRLKINMNVKSTNLYTIMNREISDLTSQDGKVLLVLDTPILGSIQEVESCAIQIKLFKESGCRISKKQFLHTRFRQSYIFKKLEASHSNTMIWDAGRELFGKDEYLEPLAKDGEYIFYDWNHISTFAASTLTKEFQNVIKNLQK